MFQNPQWTNYFLLIVSAIFMSLIFNSPARAADTCGGNIPCQCGNTLTASRTLVSGVDPIVASTCTGDGLIINTAEVVLDLNGNKLRGSGSGAGVLIDNGVNNVTIKKGRVDGFQTGIGTGTEIDTAGTTNGSTIEGIRPNVNTGHGILLKGDNNDLIGILAKRSGINGVTVIGNNNLFQDHNDEYNGFHGLFVQGDFNQLIDNRTSENAKAKTGSGDGIHVEGSNNTIEGSDVTKLNINGIVVVGNENTLNANSVEKQKGVGTQGGDGIRVDGDNNVLTDNAAAANTGFGIRVVGAGDATASTGNQVSLNRKQPQCSIYGATTPPTCIQH